MIEVNTAQVRLPDGSILCGLDAALRILKSGMIFIDKGPFAGKRVSDRKMRDFSQHRYFVSPGEKRRGKTRMAVQRIYRQQRKIQQKMRRDPKIFFAEQEYNRIKAAEKEIAEIQTSHAGNSASPKNSSIATVLALIQKIGKRLRKRVSLYLTAIDEEKGGQRGFITGGVETGETVQEAARRETKEETGLEAEVADSAPLFHELNVAFGGEKPYFMKGLLIKKFSGKLRTGEEIKPGSLQWLTTDEIDEQIISGRFLPNHAEMWNIFCSGSKKETENKEVV